MFSKFKNSKCRKFGKEKRVPLGLKKGGTGTPGPGYYTIPSDFGIYENKPKSSKINRKNFKFTFSGRNGKATYKRGWFIIFII